jgi:hypothetical protein
VRIVDTDSSARVPPSATCLSESLGLDEFATRVSLVEEVNILHILGNEFAHDATGKRDAGQKGTHSQSQSPVSRICQDETGKKCRKEADGDGDLLGYALMDQIWMCGVSR